MPSSPPPPSFPWIPFYEAIADKLLDFRHRRDELLDGLHTLTNEKGGLVYTRKERYNADGVLRPLERHLPIYNHGHLQSKYAKASIAKPLQASWPNCWGCPNLFRIPLKAFRLSYISNRGFSTLSVTAETR